MSDDELLICLKASLRRWTPIFCIISPDGTLQRRGAEFLQSEYSGRFKTVGASSFPTQDELYEITFSSASPEIERSYQGLLKFIGCKSSPWILIISNTESLSADQALTLRGCLSERESDVRTHSGSWSKSLFEAFSDWPRSMIFVLKQDESLPDELGKFVIGVIDSDAVTDDH
jgi:hypothetical protein